MLGMPVLARRLSALGLLRIYGLSSGVSPALLSGFRSPLYHVSTPHSSVYIMGRSGTSSMLLQLPARPLRFSALLGAFLSSRGRLELPF